uniref:tRNA dimethylallyltransferase n=1 Tax=Desulfacinum infernum TaxID=35837 RepID=A0A831ZY33_9BACT
MTHRVDTSPPPPEKAASVPHRPASPECATLPVVLIAGPTAVGKTALSLNLAETLGTEIINADSMQVYRSMDIGTAKPTPEERARIRHHLMDVVDPDEHYDAALFVQQARPIIEALHARGKVPLVVGGTGLYMKALTRGLCPGPAADPEIRRAILQDLERQGLPFLYDELRRVDPVCAAKIHPNDRQRIVRALEVFRSTGVALSQWQDAHGFRHSLYRTVKIALCRERRDLHERIDRRVLAMMAQGLLDEVRALVARGYPCTLKSMQSLGYRHMCLFLAGKVPLDEAVRLMQRDTRRYAKRQLTWFKGDPEFRWFHADEPEKITRWVLQALDQDRSRFTL